ncbi:MAG TPA: sigma 54-interacting transcriptional regulator, partial [Labilithrix sp.]|nr:sigma 54-interacting transcriptional regulator [Labilithrix sp.]
MDERPRAASPNVSLVVTRGPDEGARLDLDGCLRHIGRARDADLVLSDLSVSRRHLDAQIVEGGVRFRALPEAAPFVVDREPVREAIVAIGSAITLGNTVLCVAPRPAADPPASRVEHTDAHTLLQGAAIEVKGLAAVTALMAWLDGAQDYEAVRATLVRWGALHADAANASLHMEHVIEDAAACEEHARSGDIVVAREIAVGITDVVVPAHAQGHAWVTFRIERPASAVGEAQRRLLLVAGRLCGSSLARIHTALVAEKQLRDVRRTAVGSARGFLGSSPEAVKLASLIPRVAVSDVAVLLRGETGVGKTFVARLIHEASPRSREPLHVVNCAAIPETLLESELFGYEKGAFTGATSSREGAFEAAGRGTLLLDEIAELSLSSQAKLLRALEERKFERLGSNRTLDMRARIVCATNKDLAAMVEAGQFRSDLLFRITVVSMRIPALRE